MEFEGRDLFDPNEQGLARNLEQAVQQEASWGIALAASLVDSRQWDTPLWEAVLRGLESEMEEAQFRQVLDLLSNPNLQARQVRSICRVLAELVKSGGRSYAPALLESATDIAAGLWQFAAADADTDTGFRHDWLTVAINRSAGPLVEFWLASLSISLREATVRKGNLTEPYKRRSRLWSMTRRQQERLPGPRS